MGASSAYTKHASRGRAPAYGVRFNVRRLAQRKRGEGLGDTPPGVSLARQPAEQIQEKQPCAKPRPPTRDSDRSARGDPLRCRRSNLNRGGPIAIAGRYRLVQLLKVRLRVGRDEATCQTVGSTGSARTRASWSVTPSDSPSARHSLALLTMRRVQEIPTLPKHVPLNVAVAGVTGWTGAAVARAIAAADDLRLCAGISRSYAGRPLVDIVDGVAKEAQIYGSVADMLARDTPDVIVDYTSADAVLGNVTSAVEAGVHSVVGSSGLSADDYAALDQRANAHGVGVIAAGNFSLLAALLARAAADIAVFVPNREIIDYGSASKVDSPSGTARELAERLGTLSAARPGGGDAGLIEARGAHVAGTQIHSVRLPGYALSTEIVFGAAGERLSLRHDPGDSPEPYVAGTLLAVRNVVSVRGVVRGIDSWLAPQPTD